MQNMTEFEIRYRKILRARIDLQESISKCKVLQNSLAKAYSELKRSKQRK